MHRGGVQTARKRPGLVAAGVRRQLLPKSRLWRDSLRRWVTYYKKKATSVNRAGTEDRCEIFIAGKNCQGDAPNDCRHATAGVVIAEEIIDGVAHPTNEEEVDEELDAANQRYKQARQKQLER